MKIINDPKIFAKIKTMKTNNKETMTERWVGYFCLSTIFVSIICFLLYCFVYGIIFLFTNFDMIAILVIGTILLLNLLFGICLMSYQMGHDLICEFRKLKPKTIKINRTETIDNSIPIIKR